MALITQCRAFSFRKCLVWFVAIQSGILLLLLSKNLHNGRWTNDIEVKNLHVDVRESNEEFFTGNPPAPTFTVPACQPVNNFAFVKTHKTGSTTLRSITSRYGYARNLSFLLNNDGQIGHFNGIFLKYSNTSSNFLPPIGVKVGDFANYRNYNISNVHLRYNRAKLNQLMYDSSNLKLFTILREPAEQWLSWFQYYKKYKKVGYTATNISEAAMPYINKLEKANGDFNQQSRDLGIGSKIYFNNSLLDQAVTEMSDEFSLVLITEYFDESLILLRKEFCWNFEDILYVTKRKQPIKITFSDDVKKKLTEYNHADVYLYQHFNKTLWKRIQEYGSNFGKDLETFRNLLKAKQEECIGKNSTTGGNRVFIEYHGSENRSTFCDLYVNEKFKVDAGIVNRQGGKSKMWKKQ